MRADYRLKETKKTKKRKGLITVKKIKNVKNVCNVENEVEEKQTKLISDKEFEKEIEFHKTWGFWETVDYEEKIKEEKAKENPDKHFIALAERLFEKKKEEIAGENQHQQMISDYQDMEKAEVARSDTKLTKGYIEKHEENIPEMNEKAIEKILESEERKEILYHISCSLPYNSEELLKVNAGFIDHWDNDHCVRYLFEEAAELTGLPTYWIIQEGLERKERFKNKKSA